MQKLVIKSHREGNSYDLPHVFVLNKGLNSGKPLKQPCANCFVVLCQNAQDADKAYWLLFGLWKSKHFYQFHRGSVIPFINLKDTYKSLVNAFEIATKDEIGFKKSVTSLKSFEELEKKYLDNIKLIQEAKMMVFYRYILKR